jgi:predicted transcriptional regulator
MNQLEKAREYRNKSLNPIPLRIPGESYRDKDGKQKIAKGKEPPFPWKEFQKRPLTASEIERLFTKKQDNNIGIVCGKVSQNLVVLDFDDINLYTDLVSKNPIIRSLSRNSLTVRTKRGIHVYVRTLDKTVSQETKEKIPHLDIKGQGGLVAAPDSIYETEEGRNGQYIFDFLDTREIQTVPFDDLSFLHLKEAEDVNASFLGLGYRYYRILKGDYDFGFNYEKKKNRRMYPSRSEAEFALILKLVSLGEGLEYVQEVFKRYGSDKTHYAEHHQPESYIETSYKNAVKWFQDNMNEVDSQIIKTMQAVEYLDNLRNTEKAVLLSLLQITRRKGSFYIGASVRELSEISNTSLRTVTKALNRFEKLEVISKRFKGSLSETSGRYIIDPEMIQDQVLKKGNSPPQVLAPYGLFRFFNEDSKEVFPESVDRTLGSDIFSFRGLNKTGFRVFQCLNSSVGKPLSVKEITAITGLTFPTVKRKLVDLEEFLTESKEGLSAKYCFTRKIEPGDLEGLARRKGVAGRREALKERYKKDRKLNNEALEYWRRENFTVKTG